MEDNKKECCSEHKDCNNCCGAHEKSHDQILEKLNNIEKVIKEIKEKLPK